MDQLLAGRFHVIRELGAGSFGSVYLCVDGENGSEVALKAESRNSRVPQLKNEYQTYAQLIGGPGIAEILWVGADAKHNFIAMERLGPSLESIFAKTQNPFSMKTVLMIAEQTLTQIQYIHQRGYVHRDVKPDNLLVGSGSKSHVIHLIDFGISRLYRDPETGRHLEITGNQPLAGTVRYASVAALQGTEQSRRDDLESLGYSWIYLLRGDLPWQNLAADTKSRIGKVLRMKMSYMPDGLCSGLPDEFLIYFRIVSRMRFTDEPDYAGLREMFRNLFLREGFVYDYVYDWTEKAPAAGRPRMLKQPSCLLPSPPPEMRVSASSGRLAELCLDDESDPRLRLQNAHAVTMDRKRIALPRLLRAKSGA
jgi:serine/threonine protein kinase